MTPEILRAHRKDVEEVRIFYFPASQTGFSRSFGWEILAAILFPSAALSSSPCVYSPSIVGTEKRTLLRSSPILTPQAPLTTNMHCRGIYKYSHNNKLLIFTCSFKKKSTIIFVEVVALVSEMLHFPLRKAKNKFPHICRIFLAIHYLHYPPCLLSEQMHKTVFFSPLKSVACLLQSVHLQT